MYERYHTEAIENAYKDIDELVKECSKQKMDKKYKTGTYILVFIVFNEPYF